MFKYPLLFLMLLATPAFADDNLAKQIAAIPALVSQRNQALDSLAICSGEAATLQAKLADLQKQLDELKPKDAPKKTPK